MTRKAMIQRVLDSRERTTRFWSGPGPARNPNWRDEPLDGPDGLRGAMLALPTFEPYVVSDVMVDLVEMLVGDEHVRSDLDERGWNVGTEDFRRGRSPAAALPYLPASTLRRAEVGDALLVHGHLPPAWIRHRSCDHRRS